MKAAYEMLVAIATGIWNWFKATGLYISTVFVGLWAILKAGSNAITTIATKIEGIQVAAENVQEAAEASGFHGSSAWADWLAYLPYMNAFIPLDYMLNSVILLGTLLVLAVAIRIAKVIALAFV